MPTPTLQQIITLALPLVAALVSYMLQQAHWSNRANTTIASITVLLAATATLWLDGRLTDNVYMDALIITSAATALQSSSFAPLQEYLKSNFPVRSQPSEQEAARSLEKRNWRPTGDDWSKRRPQEDR